MHVVVTNLKMYFILNAKRILHDHNNKTIYTFKKIKLSELMFAYYNL